MGATFGPCLSRLSLAQHWLTCSVSSVQGRYGEHLVAASLMFKILWFRFPVKLNVRIANLCVELYHWVWSINVAQGTVDYYCFWFIIIFFFVNPDEMSAGISAWRSQNWTVSPHAHVISPCSQVSLRVHNTLHFTPILDAVFSDNALHSLVGRLDTTG